MNRNESFFSERFGDNDVEGRKLSSERDLVVSFLLFDKCGYFIFCLAFLQGFVEGINYLICELLVVPSEIHTFSVIFYISSLIFNGHSGPLRNCSMIWGLMLLLVCWLMLLEKAAICL